MYSYLVLVTLNFSAEKFTEVARHEWTSITQLEQLIDDAKSKAMLFQFRRVLESNPLYITIALVVAFALSLLLSLAAHVRISFDNRLAKLAAQTHRAEIAVITNDANFERRRHEALKQLTRLGEVTLSPDEIVVIGADKKQTTYRERIHSQVTSLKQRLLTKLGRALINAAEIAIQTTLPNESVEAKRETAFSQQAQTQLQPISAMYPELPVNSGANACFVVPVNTSDNSTSYAPTTAVLLSYTCATPTVRRALQKADSNDDYTLDL